MIAKLKVGEGDHRRLRRRPGHAVVAHRPRRPRRTTSRSGSCSAPRTPTPRCSAAATTRSSGSTRSACRRCPRRRAGSGPAVHDPRLAVGQGPGRQDVQGARAGAADLLHRAAPRRPEPDRRVVPRRAVPLPVGRDAPDRSCTSRGATTTSGRAPTSSAATTRRQIWWNPDATGRRRGRQRGQGHVGVLARTGSGTSPVSGRPASRHVFDAGHVGHAVRRRCRRRTGRRATRRRRSSAGSRPGCTASTRTHPSPST